MSEEGASEGRRGGVAWGVAAFLAYQYARGLRNLTERSGAMDSKFNEAAVEDYLGYLVGQNLLVLAAYLLLGVAAWLVLVPALHPLRRRWRWLRGWRLAPVSLAGCAVMHEFFLLRMVRERPYFTGDASFGGWYEAVLELPPEGWRPFLFGGLFDVLPWLAAATAVLWWWSRGGRRTRRVTAVGALVLAAGWTVASGGWLPAGGAGEGAAARPNVLVIGSDSLRGDKLGYAGYRPARGDGPAAEGVSPHIDRWARDAAIFENCRTPIGSTLESGISMMTSTYPHSHGIRQLFPERGEVEAMRERVTPLADVLEARGYETATVGDWCAGYFEITPLGFDKVDVSSFDNFRVYMSQAVFMAHFVVPLYFDNDLGYRLFPQIRSFASFVTPEVVTDRVEEMLRERREGDPPFFWNVFYSSNHLPYRASEPYCRMFADPDYEGPNETGVDFDINEFIGGTDLEEKWAALPRKEVRQIRALYDGCTRQFDANFRRILETLEETGEAERTIVVLTSDHGDDLYEPGVTLGHGLSFHGRGPSYHVPLAIRVPGGEGRRFSEQVRTIDLAPTLAGLAGAPAPEAWEGVDLSPWMARPEESLDLPYYGETQFPFIQFRVDGVERPPLPPMDGLAKVDAAFNHQFVLREKYRERVIAAKQRCLRTRDWKLVCTPTASGGRHFQLYHTASDPDCRRDLIDSRPEVAAPLERALVRWMDAREETPIAGMFPGGEPAGPRRPD